MFLTGSISVIARVATDCNRQGFNPISPTEGTGFTNQALTAPGLEDHLWSEFPTLPYFSTLPPVTAMNTQIDKCAPGLRNDTLAWSEFAVQS